MPGKLYPAPANSNPDTNTDESEETEESTEDSEVENEEQDDAEEETDSEETEEEEESTDESDEGEVEGEEEQYIDLKAVPPQLQIAAKKMLASHTKAMQKVAVQVEEAKQDLQNQYSQHVVKAAGFDRIIQLPGWENFYNDMQNGKPYGYSSEFRNSTESSPPTNKKGEASAPADGKVNVDDIVQRLTPAISKMIERAIEPMKADRNRTLWADAEKLPNFKLYKTKITELMTKHPTLSLQEAYEMAGGKNEAVNKALKDATAAAKKLPRPLKPGNSGGTKPLSEKVVNTIDDALNLASRELSGTRGG